jgi:hypothetical protein
MVHQDLSHYFFQKILSQHASMDHVSSHHHAGPLLDDSCHVLMDPSPSQYDVGPLSTSTSTLSSTPIVFGQTPMVDVDPIDDSSNLPIANVSSLFQDTLVSGSSSAHVVDDDALVNGSSNPHVAELMQQSFLLVHLSTIKRNLF